MFDLIIDESEKLSAHSLDNADFRCDSLEDFSRFAITFSNINKVAKKKDWPEFIELICNHLQAYHEQGFCSYLAKDRFLLSNPFVEEEKEEDENDEADEEKKSLSSNKEEVE